MTGMKDNSVKLFIIYLMIQKIKNMKTLLWLKVVFYWSLLHYKGLRFFVFFLDEIHSTNKKLSKGSYEVLLLAKNPGEVTTEAQIATLNIAINVLDENCLSQPCQNGGSCLSNGKDRVQCECTKGNDYSFMI